MGFMNARRLILAAAVSLSSLTVGGLLVAPGALAEELCPNAAARQGPSAALPDCRAYEQVTPLNKGDSQDLFPSTGLTQHLGDDTPDVGYAAEDGKRFLLNTAGSFAGGDAYTSTYVFSRGTQGWTTTSLSPGPGVHEVQANVFDPADLSEVGLEDLQLNHVPGSQEERLLATAVGPPGGPYASVVSLQSESVNEGDIVGASNDLSHVVVESKSHALAPGASGQDEGTRVLYEWFNGHLRLVNVETDGSLVSQCGAVLGEGHIAWGSSHNAVSGDGSRVIFTAPDPFAEGAGCWNESKPTENAPQLYMRLNGTSTVEVSKPDPGVHDPDGPQLAFYVGASTDGSKIFFMSSGELTPDDTTHAPELYEYDAEAPEGERLVRVSRGESGDAEGNVDFIGAVSSDGSTVYFTAFGKLAQGASALDTATKEGVNLYRYDTATGKTTYITRLNNNDYPLTPGENGGVWQHKSGGLSTFGYAHEQALVAQANWYTTADGRYLVFGTTLPLTGFDNTQAPRNVEECAPNVYAGQPPEQGKERCLELFRYDAATNAVVCVSCGPANVRPTANAEFTRDALELPSAVAPRPISEDGNYVFFETTTALVPQTTSGTLHVYEWHDGTISLISSAGDPANAYFEGASADGSNVFFGTHAQLAPQDTDVNGDLYDARIDGGFVGLTPPQCTGTGCQGVPGAPPIFATPASVTFEGVGNFEPSAHTSAVTPKRAATKCAKGKQLDHGTCVGIKRRKRKANAMRTAKGRK